MGGVIMTERLKPDWSEWAKKIVDRSELEEVLERAYTKGYEDGLEDADLNWWEEFDDTLEDDEEHA
jgi:hypothetical protein